MARIPKQVWFFVLGISVLAGSVACGSSSSGVFPYVEGRESIIVSATADVRIVDQVLPHLNSVNIIPAHIFLYPGETTKLLAAAYDQRGRPFQGVEFAWRMNVRDVGTVTSGGVFRAGFTTGTFKDAIGLVGTPRVGSRMGPVAAEASVTIIEPRDRLEVASIRVFPGTVEVHSGEDIQLFAYALAVDGTVIPGSQLQWKVNDPQAGTVSSDGLFLGGTILGTFTDAIQVFTPSDAGSGRGKIVAVVDAVIVDPGSLSSKSSATVLPRVISLREGETVHFDALMMDGKGARIVPSDPMWEVLVENVGNIDEQGLFTAGSVPGVYTDAVRFSGGLPGLDDGTPIDATATVVILDVAGVVGKRGSLHEVAIFPDKVVLSPGRSERLSLVSLDGNGHNLTDVQVRWSLDDGLGTISSSGNVVANGLPGIYPGAIRVEVSQIDSSETPQKSAAATLVITGTITMVELTPQAAIVTPGGTVFFRATASDENGFILSDVLTRWNVTDEGVGRIDARGQFVAVGEVGEYKGLVVAEVVQLLPES
jgi:hypothetical protein